MSRPIPADVLEVVNRLIDDKVNDMNESRKLLAGMRERGAAIEADIFKMQEEVSDLRAWIGEAKPPVGDGFPYG